MSEIQEVRKCSYCGQEKPVDEMYSRICYECMDEMGLSVCSYCGDVVDDYSICCE